MSMKELLRDLVLRELVDPEQVRAAMQSLAAQRKHGARACVLCGAIVDGLATRRYCSNACRQRAKYRRAHPEVKRQRPAPPAAAPRSGEADA